MTSAGSSRTISAGSESRSHSVIRNSPVEMSIQPRAGDRHQIIVALGVEEGVFGERAGRHQADHVAPHYSFRAALLRFSRLLELLAHCDAMAERNQAVQVLIGTLNWHAAHRDVLAEMLAALGEHDAERARTGFGVVKEHFVEVAHPVEQDAIRIGRLDLDVLLHHRSHAPCVALRRFRLGHAHGVGYRPRLKASRSSEALIGKARTTHTRSFPRRWESGDQAESFTWVIRSRLPCQIPSLSAFGMSMPSRMRSVSRVYIVPFSGSNGQSEANTILSRS